MEADNILTKERKNKRKPIVCGIYKITSPIGCIYIGKATNIHKRWESYRALNCQGQPLLYESLLEHGPENHIFEILEECNGENLRILELYYICVFDTYKTSHGLNSVGTRQIYVPIDLSDKQRFIDLIKQQDSQRGYEHNKMANMRRIQKMFIHKKLIHFNSCYYMGIESVKSYLIEDGYSCGQIDDVNGIVGIIKGDVKVPYISNLNDEEIEKLDGIMWSNSFIQYRKIEVRIYKK